MSTKVKAIITAVLALIMTAFGWYVAYSDGDESTTPDTGAVISAAGDVYEAATADDATATATTESSTTATE